jgi:O-antigen ligase
MAWALVFALAIGLIALHKGELKPFKNKWALAIVGFSLLSFYMSPNPALKFFGVDSGRFWSWEPLYQGIVFLLFTVSVASIDFSARRLSQVLTVMMWSGVGMSALVIIQALRLDQFFEHVYGTYGHMSGTLGNPTLVGPFLCLCIPIALRHRERVLAGLMAVALIATRSDVAVIGLVATLFAYYVLRNRKRMIMGIVVAAVVGAVVVGAYISSPKFRAVCPDNERFLTSKQALTDLITPVMQGSKKIYAVTGIGPGSFMYLYHAKHNVGQEAFLYAHNDPVQVAYELGVVGFFIFMGMLFFIFKQGMKKQSEDRVALLASLFGILVCSCGIFVLQIGTHIFYTLTIVGLLSNDTV